MTWLDPFIVERDALNDRIAMAAHNLIAGHLRALNEHYPRHTFAFVQGMGTEFITVSPDVFNCSIMDNVSGLKTLRGYGGMSFFFKHNDAIMAIAQQLWEEFDKLEIGDVS